MSMTATPEEKVTVPVSREILAEVDDVMHLGPEGTVDYVLKDFARQVQARRAALARARELVAEGSLDVEFLEDKGRCAARCAWPKPIRGHAGSCFRA